MVRETSTEDKKTLQTFIWELKNIEYCLNFLIDYGKVKEGRNHSRIHYVKSFSLEMLDSDNSFGPVEADNSLFAKYDDLREN